MPEIEGLVSAAIAESGGGQLLVPQKVADEVGASFGGVLDCSDGNLCCLQSRSIDQLATAYESVPAILYGKAPGQKIVNINNVIHIPDTANMRGPILDGKFITQEPTQVDPKVPLIAGTTQRDAAIFTIPYFEESGYEINEKNYTEFLEAWGPELTPEVTKRYPLSLFNTTGSAADAVVAAVTYIVTKASMICPSQFALLSAEANGMNSFGYRFNHTPSCPWLVQPGIAFFPSQKLAPVFGPAHTSDLPYVFGNLDNMPFQQGHCNSTAAEYEMSSELVAAWTAMISGNPSTDDLDWPKYTLKDGRGVIVNDMPEVVELDFEHCDFWAEAWSKLTGQKFPWM